jgi:hypothetical protein
MGKAIFSQGHFDRKQTRRRSRAPRAPEVSASGPPLGGLPLRGQPTEEERRQLRRSQIPTPSGGDPDLQGYWRRTYTLQDGTTNRSEPRVLPPRDDLRKPRTIYTDPDLRQDLDDDPDLHGNETRPRVAALTIRDEALNRVDRLLTQAQGVLQNLAEACEEQARRSHEDSAVVHHAEQSAWIAREALLPWLGELSDQFDQLLQGLSGASRDGSQDSTPAQGYPS